MTSRTVTSSSGRRWTPWVPGLGRSDPSEPIPDLVHAGALPYSSVICEAVGLAHRTGALQAKDLERVIDRRVARSRIKIIMGPAQPRDR